jgi:regulatory protein
MAMPPRPVSIKVRALQWLAQREHSRDEMRGKLLHLLKRSSPSCADNAAGTGALAASSLPSDAAAEVDALLDWLEAHGHLSQARFLESRVHARQSRFGNLRIRQELQQHGVALDADAQQALQHTEFDRAHEVWRKKYGVTAEDATARVRQMRFLAGRGFSIDVVRRVVRQGLVAADDPVLAADGAGT